MLGAELRRARHEAGITQPQLAVRLGAAPAYVARLEAGGVGASAAWATRWGGACGLAKREIAALAILAERVSFQARLRVLLAGDPRRAGWAAEVVGASP